MDNRYVVIRKDRVSSKSRREGIFIALNNIFSFEILETDSKLECINVKIKTLDKYIYICIVYFPPNSQVNDYNNFFALLETFLHNGSEVLILDFNLPCYESDSSEQSVALKNFCHFNNLRTM